MKIFTRLFAAGVLALLCASSDQALARGETDTLSPSLSGIVVNESRRPIESADLRAFVTGCDYGREIKRREIGTARSNNLGRFALNFDQTQLEVARSEAFPGEPKILVMATAAGRGLAAREYSLQSKSQRIELELPREKILAGEVFSARQKPLAGARVTVTFLNRQADQLRGDGISIAPPDEKFWTAMTNARGKFEIRNLPPDIAVSLNVAPPAWSTPEVIPLARLRLKTTTGAAITRKLRVILPPAAKLQGRVFQDGKAQSVAGAKVSVWSESDSRETKTDGRGLFQINDLAPGNYSVLVSAENAREPLPDARRDVEMRAGSNPALKIGLKRGFFVSGATRDKNTKKPLGAWVHAYRLPDANNSSNGDERAIFSAPIGKDGKWKLAVAPGRYQFQVFGLPPDYVEPEELDESVIERDVSSRQPTPPLLFEFRAAPPLKIQVVNAGGQPVSNARVVALWDKTTRTDARGEAILRGARKSENVLVIDDARQMAGAATVSLENPRVMVLPFSFATGQVADNSGKPLAGALVSAMLSLSNVQWNISWAVSGKDGRYRIALAPNAKYSFDATAPEYGSASIKQLETRPASTLQVEIVKLPRADLELSGVVKNAANQPVAGASVTASQGAQTYLQANTDSKGRFVFKGLASGKTQVAVYTSSVYAAASLEATAGAQNLRIVLKPKP